MRYVGGMDETGQPIELHDPLADRLRAASDAASSPEAKVAALLAIDEVFAPDLVADTRFSGEVTRAYRSLVDFGAAATVARYVA